MTHRYDAALWIDHLRAIIPKKFEEHASMIQSRYADTGGNPWGSNLLEFAGQAKERFVTVQEGLAGATP